MREFDLPYMSCLFETFHSAEGGGPEGKVPTYNSSVAVFPI